MNARRALRLLPLTLLLAAVLVIGIASTTPPSAAEAQESTVDLVSNINNTLQANTWVIAAQGFTTGNLPEGYTLTEVQIQFTQGAVNAALVTNINLNRTYAVGFKEYRG